ncbi:MAG: MarR family transcriptional regulator [Caulobacteraceae bacterium]|nr:MarR family transcriptional regulator [Caulobacteraceae bacterium]
MAAETSSVPATGPAEAAPADKQALRLWLRLLDCSGLVEKIVRTRLAETFDTTLPRFDVLAALERAPQGLQLGELSRWLKVSNGNVTGIVTRLTAEGLIDRTVDPNDGRVFRVSLTAAGREAFLAMAAAHEAWINTLFEGLGAAEQGELLTLLTRLQRSVAERAAEPGSEA